MSVIEIVSEQRHEKEESAGGVSHSRSPPLHHANPQASDLQFDCVAFKGEEKVNKVYFTQVYLRLTLL